MLTGTKKITDFSDVCMGSGSLTLAYIYQTYIGGGASAVSRLNIHGEDLSGNKIKVAMLQILNLLDILGGGQPLYVHSMNLRELNSLSREIGSVQYHFSGPNNPNCRLDNQQRALIEQAVKCGVPEDIISQRLRVPISLVKREQQRLLLPPV
jgi:hypothetical protein